MAKKNSSKTATEKALQSSEPRIQQFTGWQGINLQYKPEGWSPLESAQPANATSDMKRQSDLKPNFMMIQNNLVSCDNGTIETRPDSYKVASAVEGYELTGVTCMFHHWLFVAQRSLGDNPVSKVMVYDLNVWNGDEALHVKTLSLRDPDTKTNPENWVITEIKCFEDQLLVLACNTGGTVSSQWQSRMFKCKLGYSKQMNAKFEQISDSMTILQGTHTLDTAHVLPDPSSSTRPMLTGRGNLVTNSSPADVTRDGKTYTMVTRITCQFCYVNEYGSTLLSGQSTIYADKGINEWSSASYLKISGQLSSGSRQSGGTHYGVTGVDVYVAVDNYEEVAYAGHFEFDPDDLSEVEWYVNWLGTLVDVTSWTNAPLMAPEENSTGGVTACYMNVHDSRLYYWGDPQKPYRLYVGGNPGAELSIARGHGGAYVDIEPGTGIEIRGTAKWKTVAGASIVTMMCGYPNTNMVKRFNLVETNTTITNEISSKGYMYEEVSNVAGCNSRWGYGVFADGLYSVNRYGLMVTTMAMEYNSQMRNQSVSDAIEPVFTDVLGKRLRDARLVHINGVAYLVLATPSGSGDLDQVIMCYDTGIKAWYTFTHDEIPMAKGEKIVHAFAIDSDETTEGLGIVTSSSVYLYPTAGPHMVSTTVPSAFNVLIETPEYSTKIPQQAWCHLSQVELRFDYYIGDPDDPVEALIEGVDYYGRPFKVRKLLNQRSHGGTDGVLRSHVEWIMVDRLVQSWRLRIKGRARFRLTHILAKLYTQSNKIGMPYGLDDHSWHVNHHRGTETDMHHYIESYNNLRDAIVT